MRSLYQQSRNGRQTGDSQGRSWTSYKFPNSKLPETLRHFAPPSPGVAHTPTLAATLFSRYATIAQAMGAVPRLDIHKEIVQSRVNCTDSHDSATWGSVHQAFPNINWRNLTFSKYRSSMSRYHVSGRRPPCFGLVASTCLHVAANSVGSLIKLAMAVGSTCHQGGRKTLHMRCNWISEF